jgi:hypothetical protein
MTGAQLMRGGVAVLLAAGGLAWMNSLGSLQIPSVLAYSGLVIVCGGIVTLFLPANISGFSRPVNGSIAGFVIGGALFAAGWFWPVRTVHIPSPSTRLDAFMPTYDFHERHELVIHASAERLRGVLNEISFADVRAMQTLGRIRAIAMGQVRTPPPGSLPPTMPILKMMNDPHSGFFPLDDTPGEIVFGLAGQPWDNAGVRLQPGEFLGWRPPDSVKIAVNFLIEDVGGGWSHVTTETRVAANDESARRKMAGYWALIYPGTGMIRRSLLEAIRVRAERA